MEKFNVGRHEIVAADCVSYIASMPKQSVDVVVTSPPYNIGVQYRNYDDRRPRDSYLAWMAMIGNALAEVLKPDGSIFLNIGNTSTDPWIVHDVAQEFRSRYVLQNAIIWIKSISIQEDTLGHFKPINSRRYLNNNYESILHFSLSGNVPIDRLAVGVPFKDKSNINRRGHAQDLRCAGNVWFMPYSTVQSRVQKYDHPSSFPVELPLRCLKLHGCAEDRLVLDPFVGTGTTLVAAEQVGLRGIGIDIDPTYALVAKDRLQAVIASKSSGVRGPNHVTA